MRNEFRGFRLRFAECFDVARIGEAPTIGAYFARDVHAVEAPDILAVVFKAPGFFFQVAGGKSGVLHVLRDPRAALETDCAVNVVVARVLETPVIDFGIEVVFGRVFRVPFVGGAPCFVIADVFYIPGNVLGFYFYALVVGVAGQVVELGPFPVVAYVGAVCVRGALVCFPFAVALAVGCFQVGLACEIPTAVKAGPLRVNPVVATEVLLAAHVGNLGPVRAFDQLAVLVALYAEGFRVYGFRRVPSRVETAYKRSVRFLVVKDVLAFFVTVDFEGHGFHHVGFFPSRAPAGEQAFRGFVARPDDCTSDGTVASWHVVALGVDNIYHGGRDEQGAYAVLVVVHDAVEEGVRVEGVVRVGDNYSRSGVGIEVAVVVLRERTGFRKVRFCLVVEVGFDSTAQNVVEEVAEVLHLYGILEEERVDSERHVQFLTGSAVRLLRGKSRRYEFFDTAVDEGVDPDGVVVCRGYRLAVDAAGESAPTAAHAAAAGRSEYEAVGVGSRHYDVGAARAAGRVAFRTGQVCDGVVVDDGIRLVGIMRTCCF